MKWTRLIPASCLAAALATTSAFGQDEPIEVRVRAIAGPDGKVQVVEERIVGKEDKDEKKLLDKKSEDQKDEKKKEEGKTDEPLRTRLFRRVHELGEKVLETKEHGLLEGVTEDVWGQMPQSDYWIGVQIAPVAPEIRKHLPVKYGVLVQQIYPDSPAIKAELKADDILLQVGEAKIETGPDLVKAIDAAKTTELAFTVLREGKQVKLNVTPIKREEGNGLALTRAGAAPRLEKLHAAQKQIELALEALRAETQPEERVELMLVRPGAFITQSAAAKLPDDVTVQITKSGNKPASVRVSRGDKNWEVTSDKLDALPKELRPHVEQMLHGPNVTFTTETPQGPHTFSMKVAPGTAVPAPNTFYAPAIGNVPNPAVPAAPRVTVVPGVATVPALPAGVAAPPVVARAATAWSHAIAPQNIAPQNSDAKLDQILKKLDSLASPDLDAMKQELKSLRKEVDELRKKTGEEKSSPRER